MIIVLRNFLCLLALSLLFPIIIFAGLIVFLEDGLPIFFKQPRLGQNQKKFIIYKIRTMKLGSPQTGTHNVSNAFQLKVGKIIRKIKLDEFPQLINVIKGDLNLVGPRPGLLTQLELTKERSMQNIYSIKPGITGLSQILGYDMSEPKQLAKIDKIFLDKRSLKLRIFILFGTFLSYPKNLISTKYKIPFNDKNL